MTSRRKLLAISMAVFASAAAVLLSLKVYYVRTDARGALFWTPNSAYFFIGLADRGYRMSYIGLTIDEIRELLPFGAPEPTDKHFSVLVLHVTPDSVQRYRIQNFWLGSDPEPFEGNLYAGNMLPDGGFMKWTGTNFEAATPLEAQKYREYAMKLPSGPPAGPSFDNVEGWSKRAAAGEVVHTPPADNIERDAKVTIDLGGTPLTFVMNSGFVSRNAYIDLERPGRAPQRIWSLDEQPRRVNEIEYELKFKSRKDPQ